ncbi:MAG TPA: radical SAM protein [Kofleriaceae bacterium]|nr:radical SAM protein [Kofleriaceae bacterium]
MSAGLDRLAARAEAIRAPLSALFELTGRCNLDCGHCYLDIAHPPDEMSTADAIRVVDALADAGTLFLTLTGGELFLRPDALEIAAHARRRGMALRLFTNGTRITRALAAEIARVRPLAVEISIYGSHADAHDGVVKRRRTLRRTLRGIVLLRRAGVSVALKAPLLSTVTGELDRLYALADRVGAKIAFDPFVKPRNDAGAAPFALRAGSADLARALAHPRMGIVAAGLSPPPSGDEAPCAIGRRTTKISPTGDVYACPSHPEPLGNLLRTPFSRLWAGGEVLDRLRSVRWRDLHGDCAGCGQAGYCNRCTAVALLEHGDALGPAREACRIADAKEQALGVPTRAHRAAERSGAQVRLHVLR